MARTGFEPALALTLRFEGGYVDDPRDPGGATNLGITRATLAAWRGRAVSKAEVRALPRAEAAAIYRARYWDGVRADDLPAGLDLAVFDCAVNAGPSRAIRLLQKALGLAEDGRLGPRTLAAAGEASLAPLIRAYCDARRDFLRSLKTFPVFGRGWTRRVDAVERAGLAMAGTKPDRPAPASLRTPTPLRQEKTMETTKSILTSRTLWSNMIGLMALGLSAFGFNTAGLDTGALTDNVFQGIAAGSFIVSSVFRVLATKRLA